MPAAAVIPAPIVYISVAAVKKLVACNEVEAGIRHHVHGTPATGLWALRGIFDKDGRFFKLAKSL